MTETKSAGHPRRDADGRLATIGDLLGVALAGLVASFGVLLVFEAGAALLRLSRFGAASGWLAAILPIWAFVEEFRAAPYGAARVAVAALAGGLGVAAGLTAAGWAAELPPLASGAVGAATLTVCYALVWHYGLAWLRHRAG
jgi:hypothetical protein